ncbi:hypothetical protein DNTS_028646 [Danionella cerebrum]|uniref:Latent transforming growth factor beta binding protein 1 n=1 Tax=Danionella cerebrum TaxID=2873325 RepID=A0A553QLA3_9TELE|nr:hypothetical protein DNTS_028646 [Danionella translucida]
MCVPIRAPSLTSCLQEIGYMELEHKLLPLRSSTRSNFSKSFPKFLGSSRDRAPDSLLSFYQTSPTLSLVEDMAVLLWDIIFFVSLFISPIISADQSGFRKLYVIQPGPSGTDAVRVSSISSLSGASGQPHSYNVELKTSFSDQVRTRRMGRQQNQNPSPSIPLRQDAAAAAGRHSSSHHSSSHQMKVSGVNVCGGQCCVGWSKTPGSQRCTKPSCSPPCKNGGMCLGPHTCVCKPGSKGKSCEQTTLPTSSHPTGPVNGGHTNGYSNGHHNVVPQRPIPQQIFPQSQGQPLPGTNMGHMTLSLKPSSGGSIAYPPQVQNPVTMMQQSKSQKFVVQQKNYHTQVQGAGPTLNRPIPLSVGHNPILVGNHTGRIKVVFTPTICKMTCTSGRCQNSCQKGNTTTIISENGQTTDTLTASNFRVVVCHLPCMNGGKCSTRDKCQCPPNFVGKFCQMPNPNGQHGKHNVVNGQSTHIYSTHTLPLSYGTGQNQGLVNVHVKHPPEASVQIHQVSPVGSNGPVKNTQSSHSYTYHSSSSQTIQHGHTRSGVIYPNQQTYLQYQPATSKSQLGRCFQETAGMQCGKALPGLSKQDACCGTMGTSWGFHKCQKCPKNPSIPLIECPHGYKRLNATRCVDIDECQLQGVCPNGNCINNMGSYRCTCNPGFVPDPSLTSCFPETPAIHEEKGACFRYLSPGKQCLHPVATQLSKQLCCCSVGKAWGPQCDRCPLPGTAAFKDICPGGMGYHVTPPYIYKPKPPNGQGKTDGHVQNNPNIRHQTPLDPPVPLPTLQQPVEALSITERQLPEIDECQVRPDICGPGFCYNTPNSYTCFCDDDVDECAENPSLCANGRCQNTPGGFLCVCEPGFMVKESGTSCSDIDECQDGRACPSGLCYNTLGSFMCSPCPDGFEGRNGQCVDINECLDERVCAHGQCSNQEGYFICTCDKGFSITPDAQACADIDECQYQSICVQGHCQNTEGSFICNCEAGFKLSSSRDQCEDLNECLEKPRACDGVGQCVNILGSYHCNCPQGYRQVNGTKCLDVDECEEDAQQCIPNGECLNTEGSFLCVCDTGFMATRDPAGCQDVDECSLNENTCGSHDEDECLNENTCGSHSTCQNTMGSFICECGPGFMESQEGHGCVDLNECELFGNVCGEATCENREGTFLCLCPDETQEFDPMLAKCNSTPPVASVERKECYFNLNDENLCDNVLASSVTKEECCCTLGAGWGDNCEVYPCPFPGTDHFARMCPASRGFIPTANLAENRDADECKLFENEICKDGFCLNTNGSYECYCKSGLYYDETKLQCVDVDECADESNCIDGNCMNTYGSYQCFCMPPLVLAPDNKRCMLPNMAGQREADVYAGICWEMVSESHTCTKPLANLQTTFTECCCLYGEAWGMDCALCPGKNTAEYAQMCNLRRPYGRDALVAGPVHEYEVGADYNPRPLNPDGTLSFFEDYEESRNPYDAFEGLRAEECGVLNGCENGRCVHINECSELNAKMSLCKNGNCINTQGSYKCVCLPGFIHSAQHNYCVPHRKNTTSSSLE